MYVQRPQQIDVTAHGQLAFLPADLKVRQAHVGLEELRPALERNGRDEIVVEVPAKDGRPAGLYVIDAVQLSGADAPKVGDQLHLGPLKGRVAYVDRDPSIAGGWAAIGTTISGIFGAAGLTKMGMAAGVLEPITATLFGSLWLGMTFIGAQYVDRRDSDDSKLSAVSTTLGEDAKGRVDVVAEQLQAKLGA